jgi:hypothetical protein
VAERFGALIARKQAAQAADQAARPGQAERAR